MAGAFFPRRSARLPDRVLPPTPARPFQVTVRDGSYVGAPRGSPLEPPDQPRVRLSFRSWTPSGGSRGVLLYFHGQRSDES